MLINNSFRDDSLLQKNESLNLRELMCLLKKNLERDELNSLQKELNEELSRRNSEIFEIIPSKKYSHTFSSLFCLLSFFFHSLFKFLTLKDDIWVSIFDLLSYNVNFLHLFRLQEVCKRWKECFPSSITKITFPKRRRHPIRSYAFELYNIILYYIL